MQLKIILECMEQIERESKSNCRGYKAITVIQAIDDKQLLKSGI